MPALMHLSDLHFGAHDPEVCAAAQRLAQRLGVALAVVSGDLTQRATASQFAQAARFVQGLHARSSLVLAGNHDVPLFAWWLRWGRAYERFAEQFGVDQEPVRQMGPFYVVGVNTTRAWRHERGSLSAAQIDHVAALLARAPPDAWCIVASHHPLVARGAAEFLRARFPGLEVVVASRAAEFAPLVAERGAPAIALIDFWLADGASLELVAQVRTMCPGTALAVISGDDDPAVADRVRQAGAHGFIH